MGASTNDLELHLPTVIAQGKQLEYLRLPSSHPKDNSPHMVFLHEGLGSISMWRNFPQLLADATGCEAIVYSRYGYGHSTRRTEPRTPRYMHDEGLLVLPEFLDQLEIERPFLFGHSDGGSIALIHAGNFPESVSGVIALAPHLMVEEVTLHGIAAARQTYLDTDLGKRLGRHHDDVDSVFWSWNDIWLSPNFRDWNIEEYVPRITAPILAIQGEDDEYATMEQIDRIAKLGRDVELVKLADCRHSPHNDQPEAVIGVVREIVVRVRDSQ